MNIGALAIGATPIGASASKIRASVVSALPVFNQSGTILGRTNITAPAGSIVSPFSQDGSVYAWTLHKLISGTSVLPTLNQAVDASVSSDLIELNGESLLPQFTQSAALNLPVFAIELVGNSQIPLFNQSGTIFYGTTPDTILGNIVSIIPNFSTSLTGAKLSDEILIAGNSILNSFNQSGAINAVTPFYLGGDSQLNSFSTAGNINLYMVNLYNVCFHTNKPTIIESNNDAVSLDANTIETVEIKICQR